MSNENNNNLKPENNGTVGAPPVKKPVAPPMKNAAPAAQDKKSNKKALAVIIPAAVLVVAGAIAAVVLLGGNKKPEPVIVTDYNGVAVTNTNGEPVTIIPETEIISYVDEQGKTQTTVAYKQQVVTVAVTDSDGKAVTNKAGEAVTEKIIVQPTAPQTTKKDGGKNNPTNDGVNIVGSTVVAVTDGTGNTGIDSQGEVITTLVPITSVPAIVEPAKTEWKYTQGGSQQDYFSDVIMLKDGTYVAANVTNSKDGDFAANKNIQSLPAPYTVLTKYGVDGNIGWQKVIGEKSTLAVITSLTPTADGGFYAAGYGRDTDGVANKGFYDAILYKFDNNGNVIWNKTFGTSTVDMFNAVCETSDGGSIAVGSVGNNDGDASGFGLPALESAACAVKYDANGKVEWKLVFGGNQDTLNGVVEGKDGSFYAVGTFYSGKLFDCMGRSDGAVVKLTADGKFADVAPIAGTGVESFTGITSTRDGGIVVVGRSNSADVNEGNSFFISDLITRGGYDAYIIKFDSSLTLRFAKAFRGQNDDRLSDVVEASNGDLLAVGFTDSSSRDLKGVTTRGGDDMVVACFDKSGNLSWARAFGGSKDDSASAICLASDGGYIIAGKTLSNDVDLKNIAPYVNTKTVAAIVKFPE